MASLHFYRYFIEENDKSTDYNLSRIIDYIWNIRNFKRMTIKFDTNWYTLSNRFIPIQNRSLRFFQISKSISNVYTGSLESSPKPINMPLYGYASCLLVPFYHLLITYQPQNSPNINEISRYLSSYIVSNFGMNKFKLNIFPIVYNLSINELTPEYKIKNIWISFDLGHVESKLSGLSGFLYNINKFTSNSHNNNNYILDCKLKNNAYKKSINFVLVRYLINMVIDEYSNIVNLSFLVKGPKDHKYKRISLNKKNNSNMLVPFNIRNNVSGEYIYYKMLYYYESGNIPKEAINFESGESLKHINDMDIHFINNPRNNFEHLKNK